MTDRGQFLHIEKVPSDISEDEWGEIQRYGRVLHKEQEEKEKKQRVDRRLNAKRDLDNQMLHLREHKQNQKARDRALDQMVLNKAAAERAAEDEKQRKLTEKMMEQKRMRLQMITDAAQRKHNEDSVQKREDYDHMMQIKKELADEKMKQIKEKAKEKQAALRVIRENDANKQRRIRDEERQKEFDAQIVIRTMKEAERKEQQRLDEIAARDRKMKNIMDTMGDLVKDNEKEKNRAAEKLYIENCIASDKLAQ